MKADKPRSYLHIVKKSKLNRAHRHPPVNPRMSVHRVIITEPIAVQQLIYHQTTFTAKDPISFPDRVFWADFAAMAA